VVPGAGHLFGEDLARLEREAGEAAGWILASISVHPEPDRNPDHAATPEGPP
jgi:hypothetical protein